MRRWPLLAAAAVTLAACIDDVKVTGSSSTGGGAGGTGTGACGGKQCPLGAACQSTADCVAGACIELRCQPPVQAEWTQITSANPPPVRALAAMAYDPVAARVVLFGGAANVTFLSDTWTLSGQTWTPVATTTSPPSRAGAILTYDPDAKQVILFGGEDSSGARGDTWAFAQSGWTQLMGSAPSPRFGAAAAWDTDQRRWFVFGGTSFNTTPDPPDAWIHAGGAWSPLSLSSFPPAVDDGAMAYDQRRKQIVLFGGQQSFGLPVGEGRTWVFDAKFQDVSPELSPPPRYAAGAAYDARRGRVVIHGGAHNGAYRADTWEWDGATWTRTVASSAGASLGASMVYDAANGRLLAFGGNRASGSSNELWQYRAWANACTADADCDDSFHCVDGLCCQQASCGTGEACNVPASPGTCTKVATP